MITKLQAIVQGRKASPHPGSYTNKLLARGITKITQKVGEEGVEVVVAGLAQNDEALLNELADLIYHCTVLLVQRDLTWEEVETALRERHHPDYSPDESA